MTESPTTHAIGPVENGRTYTACGDYPTLEVEVSLDPRDVDCPGCREVLDHWSAG